MKSPSPRTTRKSLSFLSQWCSCTTLSLLMVWLHLSFLKVSLMWGSPLLALEWSDCIFFSLWIITPLWRLSSHSSWFIHPLYGKSSFHVTLAIPFILNLMLSKPPPCTFPQNHPHSSIIYILLSCPNPPFQNRCGPFPWASSALSYWLHLHGKKPLTNPERASKHPHAAKSPS